MMTARGREDSIRALRILARVRFFWWMVLLVGEGCWLIGKREDRDGVTFCRGLKSKMAKREGRR